MKCRDKEKHDVPLQVRKTYGGREVELHVFLTSAPHRSEGIYKGAW